MTKPKPTRSDDAYVDDILVAARAIHAYMRGVTQERFVRDRQKVDAVIRQIGIIGEAAGHLSAAFRAKYPGIPWHEITKMRHIVVHQYWDVKLEIVWDVATQGTPDLLKRLEPHPATPKKG